MQILDKVNDLNATKSDYCAPIAKRVLKALDYANNAQRTYRIPCATRGWEPTITSSSTAFKLGGYRYHVRVYKDAPVADIQWRMRAANGHPEPSGRLTVDCDGDMLAMMRAIAIAIYDHWTHKDRWND